MLEFVEPTKSVQFRLIGSGGAFLNNWKSMQRSDDYHPPISWLTYEPDYHWLWLIIIDYHWLSWIIIGYHGLSLIATGYHWLSLEIYAAVQWLSSSNSLIDLMSLIGSTDLNQILYWSFGYLAFCEPAWPLTNLNHWPDVHLLSLTAIKGWKSQHWFIWRVLSPSGPFQALTKITEKDQQDQWYDKTQLSLLMCES